MKQKILVLAGISLAFLLTGCIKLPTVSFTATVQGYTVTFTDASSGNGSDLAAWLWNFDDGQTSALQNPVHTYTAAGTYNVSLTITNARDRSNTASMAITVPAGEESAFSILGWTRTTSGSALGGVKVSVAGTEISTYTDAHGLYAIEEALTGPSVTVKFEKEGYVTSSVAVDLLPNSYTTVNAVLVAMADPVPLDSDVGGEADDGQGNKLILPPGALIRKDGSKAVTGEVDVHITPLDVTSADDLSAFPGEFRAIMAAKSEGTVQLETFALADFTIMQDDAELDLAPNKGDGATIELVLPDSTSLSPGETVPLWYFDEEQGLWLEQGSGEVVQNKAGDLVYRATIGHLSWWNCDKPIEETHCLTGTVVDENGVPIANARVSAEGVDYSGSSYAYTAADGSFCIDVKRNSQIRLNLYLPGGNMVMDSLVVTVPDSPAQCASGNCTPVARPLSPHLDACVSGVVKDELGAPVVGVTVRSSLGITAVTDSTGYFCMNVPSDLTATFFVLGRPPISVTVPMDQGSCDDGGCVEIALTVEYPDDNDFVGTITANLSFSQDTHALNATAMFVGFGPLENEFNADPPLGCQVFTFNSGTPTEGEAEAGEGEAEVWDDTMNLPILDPGSPGDMTNGPLTTPMRRMSDIYPDSDVQDYGMFIADYGVDYTASFLYEPGDLLTFSWPGGFDIGEFSESIELPGDPTPTNPSFEEGYVGFPFALNQALAVVWTPGGSDYVRIQLGANSINEDTGEFATTMIICNVEDNGAYTIPQDLMLQLPEDGPDTTLMVWMNFSMNNSKAIQVPLVHGGQGRMLMTGSSSAYAFWTEPALPPEE